MQWTENPWMPDRYRPSPQFGGLVKSLKTLTVSFSRKGSHTWWVTSIGKHICKTDKRLEVRVLHPPQIGDIGMVSRYVVPLAVFSLLGGFTQVRKNQNIGSSQDQSYFIFLGHNPEWKVQLLLSPQIWESMQRKEKPLLSILVKAQSSVELLRMV